MQESPDAMRRWGRSAEVKDVWGWLGWRLNWRDRRAIGHEFDFFPRDWMVLCYRKYPSRVVHGDISSWTEPRAFLRQRYRPEGEVGPNVPPAKMQLKRSDEWTRGSSGRRLAKRWYNASQLCSLILLTRNRPQPRALGRKIHLSEGIQKIVWSELGDRWFELCSGVKYSLAIIKPFNHRFASAFAEGLYLFLDETKLFMLW